ncbi:MAG: hypothetical protein N3F09_08275 [Bacteroidia bacterium]|nr:hypothetical protein [Bacteroidia bacterium]
MIRYILFIALFFVFGISFLNAAGPPPPPPSGGPPCWPPPCTIPIDGGIGFLMAAGLGYGIKKIHEKMKKAE